MEGFFHKYRDEFEIWRSNSTVELLQEPVNYKLGRNLINDTIRNSSDSVNNVLKPGSSSTINHINEDDSIQKKIIKIKSLK